jgi:hypothetical protein
MRCDKGSNPLLNGFICVWLLLNALDPEKWFGFFSVANLLLVCMT